MLKEVLFYEPEDSNGYLSNFSVCHIEINHELWPTSEHYYQAMKFHSATLRHEILHASTPDQAFELSRKYASEVREDWLAVRVDVMHFIVMEKFTQNPILAHHLVNTGDSIIKEHSHCDEFWGDGGDGSGLNQLGQILMTVRAYLKDTDNLEANKNALTSAMK